MEMPDVMDSEKRRRMAERAERVLPELAGHGVTMVALTFVDNAGITRTKAVPLAKLPAAARWGVGASKCFDGFSFDSVPVPSDRSPGVVGDLRLHPDLDRLTPFAAVPGWAWAPADRFDQDGNPHPGDQRATAAAAVAALRERGLTARMALEVEWALGMPTADGSYVPAAGGPAYGFARLTERAGYLAEVVACLEAQGIEVAQVHPEYADGQFELSIAAADPVRAADEYVIVRETIRAVSREHGTRASFSPAVVAGGVGNGGHLHCSVWSGERNLLAEGTGAGGEWFAAGVLNRLPALLAVGAPSAASYLRLVPQHWAGVYRCWGMENREAALRWIAGADGQRDIVANIEVKCFDQTANPYLAVAGLLLAGAAGYRDRERLPAPVHTDPGGLTEQRRAELGIERLPVSLPEAVAAFESDAALREGFGEPLSTLVTDNRRAEHEHFAGATPEQIAAEQRWTH